MENNNSGFLKLNLRDFAKALVVTVLASVLPAIQSALSGGAFDWKGVLKIALASAIGYIGKQLLTSSDGKLLGRI